MADAGRGRISPPAAVAGAAAVVDARNERWVSDPGGVISPWDVGPVFGEIAAASRTHADAEELREVVTRTAEECRVVPSTAAEIDTANAAFQREARDEPKAEMVVRAGIEPAT